MLEVTPLFPIPVAQTVLGRDYTKEELEFINSNRDESIQNYNSGADIGNHTSKNYSILDSDVMSGLKKFIEISLNEYYFQVVGGQPSSSLYITQSWVNWTDNQKVHHKHIHPNSIISGVLYINADEYKDEIKFTKSRIDYPLQFTGGVDNSFSSTSHIFLAKTGILYMFPSTLQHEVPPAESTETRISLAFNTWIRGSVGEYNHATLLRC